MLRPKSGECCVFCSFGTLPCTPVPVYPGGGRYGCLPATR